jgi:non-heme chloroperoxidase
MSTTGTTTAIKSVELSGDIEIPYIELGDSTGVPVLFLHGLSDSWLSFEGVLPHLPGSMHAFALSQRGHGDATHPAAGYYPEDFAADLAAFMDTLGLGTAVIAGHSIGSRIAQRFALDYPDRTRGLVLMGSFTTMRGNPPVMELWDVVSKLADPVDPAFVRDFQVSTLAHPVPPAFLNTVVRESLKVPARVWRAVLDGLLVADFSADLREIKAPTLIAWGDRDAFFPRSEQQTLAAAIAGSRLMIYPGGGHAFHWEDPRRFAADLTAFTAGLSDR